MGRVTKTRRITEIAERLPEGMTDQRKTQIAMFYGKANLCLQMQYGSIGWSVGAALGYAQAAKDRRVIACIGDGSFQVFYEEELIEAIETATEAKKDCLCFIEEQNVISQENYNLQKP
ncbi:Thiamine pyrophosphate enzyme, C-terminal TPP-binding [Dillenia turbinata]|uniref:pyruvate decarboxylase n=1 Tax=Dillenia turbinata TaxID=194707 RepID=A0AAN8ZMP2_9MAGN